MSNKKLTERLNVELDAIGVPTTMSQRVQACSKMFGIPKFKIASLLDGVVTANAPFIDTIARELEVDKNWLLGRTDKKNIH